MDPKTQRELLTLQSKLKRIINRLEPTKSTLPAGAFAGLTTAEDELGNALGKLEQSKGNRP